MLRWDLEKELGSVTGEEVAARLPSSGRTVRAGGLFTQLFEVDWKDVG